MSTCRTASIHTSCVKALCRALHLRHTFATNIMRNTKNTGEVKEVAEILGDGYDVVLRTYFHTDSEKKVDLVDSLIA